MLRGFAPRWSDEDRLGATTRLQKRKGHDNRTNASECFVRASEFTAGLRRAELSNVRVRQL